LRLVFISILSFAITGCVNYVGIHSHSVPYTSENLLTKHGYPLPPPNSMAKSGQWWDMFQDPQLNILIAAALSCSPNIQIAENRLARAYHLAEAAGASLLPTIDFSGYIRREHFTKNGLIPPPFADNTRNSGKLSANLNYEVDFWGKNRETIAAKVSETMAAQADLAQARLVLSTAVAASYFQLQYDLALEELVKKIVQQRQQLLAIIQLRAKHSLTSVIPVSSAQLQVDYWQLLLEQIQQYILIQRNQLAVLMGESPFTTEIAVNYFQYNPQLLAMPSIIPANFLDRRPDIAASRWRVEAAAHFVNVEKALFFPDVNLLAFFSFQSIGLTNLFKISSRDYAGQAAFTLPIFDAGYLRASLKAKYDEYDAAVGKYNQTIITALQQVADQLSALQTVTLQIKTQKEAVTIAKNNYYRNDLLYQHGVSDYTEVLTAQASLLYQQLFLLIFENMHIQSTISLINALGGDYYCLCDEWRDHHE
jgi:NodT family efflux transporter outer membrane factor (OMF) lipoprotein